jgi:tRNA nucleotidyltransferase/poly(A) polymerase
MGSKLDKQISDAIKKNPDLHEVSPERIHDEFLRGVGSAKDRKAYLRMVDDHDLFEQIFPGLDVDDDFTSQGLPPVQLAALLRGNKPKDIQRVLRDMKYTKDEIAQTLFLLKMQDLSAAEAPKLKKGFERFKLTPFHLVEAARVLGKPDAKETRAFVEYAQNPPALTGEDLLARGMKKGPEMGKAIAEAEEKAYREILENA